MLVAAPHLSADTLNEDDHLSERGLATIIDFIPSKEQFRCEPRCDGKSFCGQFHDIDSCLNIENQNACFWSCEE